ncbi:MAG TPA: condensation domain-containing protein, partial [Gordonia sp. (in: high G+C Gram-positive bacteria)]|nr:condensation domain-containing protein [Gordonia sp. (in: high G+C Gram-positive bacteria)]
LAGLPDVLELPADRPRPQVASYRGADLEFAIPADIADGVSRVASSRDVTPFMVVHAAFAALLARMAATNDIAVATPVAGRGQAVLDPLVGMFVNTLVLRTAIESSMSFAQLLDRVRVDDLDAFDHADVPFESVVEAIDPVRSEAFAPLAQVMLSFDPGASVAGAQVSLAGLEIAAVEPPLVAAQLDLRMVVASADAGNPWSGAVTYATDLFDESTVGDLADRFVRLLGALVADPAVSIGDAPLLDPAERTGLVDRSVGAGVVVPAGSVADAVAAQVVRSPDASALWFEGRSVSYAELSARVSVLARELISLGVGPDVAVGVCIDRSIEMVVAIHAVVAAGGQYVPIATDAPADRVQYMLETAGVGVVLIPEEQSRELAGGPRHEGSGEAAPWGERVMTIVVDCTTEVDLATTPVADAERLAPLSLDNALYTLFTSGSTGRPKG